MTTGPRRWLTRLARVLAIAAGLAAPAQAADGPPVPVVVEGGCPFECCTYGDWTAREPIPVRPRRDADSAAVGALAPGETFEAVTGRVVVREAGRVSVSKPHELVRLQSLETGEYLNPHERTTVAPGETIHVLNYRGEGEWNVWYDGEIYQDNGMDWRFGRYRDTRPVDAVSATLEEKPEREWWVRVRTDDGGTGWILMDDVAVDGNDACAGDAQ